MLKRCEETNLVLNWEKCHFMVKEVIVLDHKVSGSGIEVDKAKIKAISKLPYPMNIKAIRRFLGHVDFYKRFIKDFSQAALPMTELLVKDAPFNFFEERIQTFDKLKHELMQAPIMIKPDWSLPFEVMCDASDYAIGAVLWQRIDKHFKPIYYASKTMNKTESYECVSPKMRRHKYFDNVTEAYKEGIMVLPRPKGKYSKQGSTSQTSFVMHKYWSKLVMLVNEPTTSPQGMKHLKMFKTPLGTTSFRIIYGKACHLPVELKHKAYYAIKNYNMDITKAGANRFLQINELDKMRLDAYESSISYKERTQMWHDKRIKKPTNYEKSDKVLLFNLRLRLFPEKLKSRLYRPFSVSKDMKNGAIELYDEDGNEFIVNKQRVKPYQKDVLDTNTDDDITLEDEGEVM
nr:reverse transcriptase domain-containing protein [Tanacetum cinerariifolium]